MLWQVLTPRYAQRLAHRFVILGLDALTMLFWFAGWIALAAAIGAYEGPAPSSYKTMQATVAFAAFAWYVPSSIHWVNGCTQPHHALKEIHKGDTY